MSVVRRCPNCGTETDAGGPCEACHEAAVRYFCTNHTPGLWLDAPTCRTCGAQFGAASPELPVPAGPSRTPVAVAARPPPPRLAVDREQPPIGRMLAGCVLRFLLFLLLLVLLLVAGLFLFGRAFP